MPLTKAHENIERLAWSLIRDIEGMKDMDLPYWYGPFECQERDDFVTIIWPNLTISSIDLKIALRELQKLREQQAA